jgi:AcrR family transcriptional regulator
MIQTEALRLFDEHGYAQTTVEEIADAAAISPRTFFRYFPTKEDVVIWDEYDPLVLELLASRPDDEPLAETLQAIVREALGGLYRRDPRRLLSRVRLSATEPEL